MMRVLTGASSWQEDEHCEKEQGMNEIVCGGAWLSGTEEVMQQLGFDNPVSSRNVIRFIGLKHMSLPLSIIRFHW
ncbi:hypothetical protein TIFTF001_015702 [Ficus carica]|uniref:Uncharacterized protein n=1 Tax=Ficus carica TaxID=3494 RepID=A0AA88A644_FICCA|nr:hypothetical protein TIFTF001_015702 [Ficus carica]